MDKTCCPGKWGLRCSLLSVLALSACTTTRLEYDRMTGTAFPNAEVVSGDTVNLSTIYLDGGHLLVIDEDETGIAPLTGPPIPGDPDAYDYMTDAELSALESARRRDPIGSVSWTCGFWIFSGTCTRYHVHGLVVDHYRELNSGTRRTSTMGRMFDATLRSAFVNYYKHTTNRNDNAKFLRSTAHEVGHAFNLCHSDGDGSTTIMNQTRVVGNSFVYEFSAASLGHLENHDADRNALFPGTGPFDCDHSSH